MSEGGQGLPEEQPTYDRISDLFQTAPARNYELSVSGGSEVTRYYIGGDFLNQEGIVKPAEYGRLSGDRKSTRLNSSHVAISYAVFCLKKKNRIAEEIPAYNKHSSLHMGAVNTKALELMDVARHAVYPKGGRYGRHAEGRANGVLFEFL